MKSLTTAIASSVATRSEDVYNRSPAGVGRNERRGVTQAGSSYIFVEQQGNLLQPLTLEVPREAPRRNVSIME